MEHLAWLDRQYRALVLREGQLLDRMLLLTRVGRGRSRLYVALQDELSAISRHQSMVARTMRAPLVGRRRFSHRVRSAGGPEAA
jgi:hypothetical protein